MTRDSQLAKARHVKRARRLLGGALREREDGWDVNWWGIHREMDADDLCIRNERDAHQRDNHPSGCVEKQQGDETGEQR